jgi:hypothetical protein
VDITGELWGLRGKLALVILGALSLHMPSFRRMRLIIRRGICLAFLCLSAASCCVYAAAVVSANRKRDKAPTNLNLSEYEKTELGVSFPS